MRDRLAGAGVGIVAFGVYVATMFPGLAAIGDTPKFQFVGAVLGTPHSPGYPIYILLSWVFAHLPIGTLAYRMNLMSATFGALAVVLLYHVLRALGCRMSVAAAGALGIGFGRVFWSQALLAEVYTLNAALFAGALLFLFQWQQTRRDRDLIGAVACVALGAAHHLTLVMAVPAFTAYALAVDARRALSRRVVWGTAALAVLSFAAYGYIWIRTVQGAPFLEAQAHSVGELLTVIRAQQFDEFLLGFSLRQLARLRVPLIAGWLYSELRLTGMLLAAAGVWALARGRRKEAIALGGTFAVITAFAIDYAVYDVEVFIILPMIALGIVAAIGLEAAIAATFDRVSVPGIQFAAAAVALLLVARGQFHANRIANDQHRHVYETQFFDALFGSLPARSAIVHESYPIDFMVLYKIIGEHAAHGRTIILIADTPDVIEHYLANGFHVYAFDEARERLKDSGIRFVDAPLPLPHPASLRHILDVEAQSIAYPLVEAVAGDRRLAARH